MKVSINGGARKGRKSRGVPNRGAVEEDCVDIE